MPKYVLDTSALLSGRGLPEGALYTTPSVLEEMRPGGRMRRKLDFYLETKIRVQEATQEALAKVKEAAIKTGDAARISETDAGVLALAIDIGPDAVILTDDYSIQNIAKALGVKYHAMQVSGIKAQFQWEYVCSGCRRKYDSPRETCPECGSKVGTKRKKEEKATKDNRGEGK